jgi:phage nucleotide-binding protein
MKIIKSGDETKKKLNILVCGESGTGKTTFCGSGDKSKTLILSAENGLLSIGPDFDCITIRKFSDLVEAANEIVLGKEFQKYDTIAMDSVTKIQETCLAHITGEDIDNIQESKLARQQDWGALGTMMSKTINHFTKMDKNFIATCLVEFYTNEKTGESRIAPMIKGSLRHNILAYFDICLHMDTKETKDGVIYYAATKKSSKHIAKDRSGKLPENIKNPTLTEIQKLVWGK